MALPVLHRPGESEGLHGVHGARELRGRDDQGERAGLLETAHPGAFRPGFPAWSTVLAASRDDDSDVYSSFLMSRRQALELHVSSHLRSPRWGVISVLKEEVLRLREMSTWLSNRTRVFPFISCGSLPSMSVYLAFFFPLYF